MCDVSSRACIGRSLAIMQLHIIFATLFRRYDFALQSDEPVSCLSKRLLSLIDADTQLQVRDSLSRRPLECMVGIKRRE